MTALVVLIVGCALLGLVTRRWWAVAVAVSVIPVYYLGLDYGWWGSGLGEFWEYPMIVMTAFCAVVTSVAVTVGRALHD